MTDLKTIQEFKRIVGTDRPIRHVASKYNNHRDTYAIELSLYQTLDLIKIVVKYLITKKELADQILLESQSLDQAA